MGVLRRRLITHPAQAQDVVRPRSVPLAQHPPALLDNKSNYTSLHRHPHSQQRHGRTKVGVAAGLTWDPGGRQSRNASFGQQGLGHWDAGATSPTLPAWTVGGHMLSPGQSPPSHCLQEARIRDPELLPLALHTGVPRSPTMNCTQETARMLGDCCKFNSIAPICLKTQKPPVPKIRQLVHTGSST